MNRYFKITFIAVGIILATGFIFPESRIEASDLMFSGRIDSCNDCHADILRDIGHGEHMGEALEPGTNYSDCAGCHDVHPEIDGPPVSVHQFSRFGNEALCVQCHFKGNRVSAAAMVLPPKSIICAACHISDFTVDDPVSIISLAIFLLGILALATVWFSGNLKAINAKGILKAFFSVRLLHAIRALIMDAILQRKLYRQSRSRWGIHGLIVFPMLIRLCWGLFVYVFARLFPDHLPVSDIMNNNHPIFGSLLFEFTGYLVVVGIILAVMRKIFGAKNRVTGLPKQGRWSLYIFGGIFIVGYIVKGMRIAMTGFPDGSETAFLSYKIALLFSGVDPLTEFYGYVWYVHAILAGLFVACLPFSRMFHMVMGPVAVVIQAVRKKEK